jgi:hypothetical protein
MKQLTFLFSVMVMLLVSGPIVSPAKADSIWLEAECASVGSLWNTVSDGTASNSYYATIQSGNNSTSSPPTNSAGYINFTFSITSSGTYYMFARVKCPSYNDDSFWVRMDGGSWVNWNNLMTTSWAWQQFTNAFSLNSGSHTLTIAYREDGAQLDKINLATSSTLPTGTGSTATNCGGSTTTTTTAGTTTTTSTTTTAGTTTTTTSGGSTDVWLEAECGNVGSLWNIPSDGSASNGLYVTIQSGNNSTSSAPSSSSGQITYNFSVSSSGTCNLWARVITPNGNDDSFWVRMDSGSWYQWNNIGPTSSWAWYQCQSYNLSSGSHTLTIAYREDGAQLDKLYIGNSTPSGTGSAATNCSGTTTTTTAASTTTTTASSTTTTTSGSGTWSIQPRCFQDGPSGSFDDIAVKDPSIVSSGGQYHLFYTGRNSSAWSIGYASASSISGLNSATHTKLSSLGSGSGIAAPQVFYFGAKGRWYLICQNGTTASYSTNTSISNPGGWSGLQSMGFSGGLDYWCIVDGSTVYCFYAANDGSHTIKRRSTSVSSFPTGWSSASTVATDTFEAPHVYKNNADGKFYMMVEEISRYQELWSASSPGGTWTKVSEQWAHINNATFTGEHWTNQISHGEILRAGTDETLPISSINNCQVLIQGTTGSGDYASLPYDLGLMSK